VTVPPPERLLAELLTAFVDPAGAAAALYPLLAPRMRASIGTQTDLERTLANTLFAPLVGGDGEIGEIEVLGGAARVRVAVDDGSARGAPYLFSLAREGADRSGAWRITGLVREDAI
jgi:hypothetical protein